MRRRQISLILAVVAGLMGSSAGADQVDAPAERVEDIQRPIEKGADTESGKEHGMLSYNPIFSIFGKALLGKRDATPMKNNVPIAQEISPGETQQFRLSADELGSAPFSGKAVIPSSGGLESRSGDEENSVELKKRREGDHYLRLSLSTCDQPTPDDSKSTEPPGALHFYIAGFGHTDPGPGAHDFQQVDITATNGWGEYSRNMSGDLYFAVHAPEASGYSGKYSFEFTASIDAYYSYYMPFQGLHLLDADGDSGAFSTGNLSSTSALSDKATDLWMGLKSPPFTGFVHDANDKQITGLSRSYCGLKNNAQVVASHKSTKGASFKMSVAGGIGATQQSYISNLNKSTDYVAFLGLPSNFSSSGPGNPTGGGTVWKALNFQTRAESNCRVIHDLPFCDSVAYSVPTNNTKDDIDDIAKRYDDQAKTLYQNFNLSLQQIQCDTKDDTQKFSLATDCVQCAAAYKQWLCAVTIPRCADLDSTDPFLKLRNVGKVFPNGTAVQGDLNKTSVTQSRNAAVFVKGAYKEVLPCGQLCERIVQKCPAALGFECPLRGSWYYNQSYGYVGGSPSNPSCNFPGDFLGSSAAGRSANLSSLFVLMVALITGLLLSDGLI